MNLFDFLILAALALCTFFALRRILRDKKQGKCCGTCAGCGGCAGCSRNAAGKPTFK